MIKSIIIAMLAISGPLAAEIKILAFAGSTRQDSCNKKLINNAVEIARQLGANVTVIDLKDYPIPFYDGDLERDHGMPENAKKIRDMMLSSKAILIGSPEYNGSLSAVLKNVIDWASRNEKGEGSREAYAGKKFAIISCSPGGGGGARGLGHLRTIIQNIGGEVIALQVSVPNCMTAFNAQGKLLSEQTKADLKQEIQELMK